VDKFGKRQLQFILKCYPSIFPKRHKNKVGLDQIQELLKCESFVTWAQPNHLVARTFLWWVPMYLSLIFISVINIYMKNSNKFYNDLLCKISSQVYTLFTNWNKLCVGDQHLRSHKYILQRLSFTGVLTVVHHDNIYYTGLKTNPFQFCFKC
jgi:hypothetical protein